MRSGGAFATSAALASHEPGFRCGRCEGLCVLGEGMGGSIRMERTSEAAPEAVRQAVGGGCQSGRGRLLSVTNAIWRLPSGGQWLGAGWAPLDAMHPWGGGGLRM